MKPTRIHVRARPIDAAVASEMDSKPTPRWLPDIPRELRDQICGVIRVHDFEDGTALWAITFAWPTFPHLQTMIAAEVAKLSKTTTWTTKDALPTTSISVSETVADLSKPAVSGVQPTKVISVSRTIKEQAAKCCFVGEAQTVAVKPVEKVAETVKVI